MARDNPGDRVAFLFSGRFWTQASRAGRNRLVGSSELREAVEGSPIAMEEFLKLPLFKIGETQATVGSLVAVAAIALVTLVAGRLARRAAIRLFSRKHEGGLPGSQTVGNIVQLLVWFIGLELALHLLGIRLTALFAAGGFFAIGAGFGVKGIVENFLAGVILWIDRTIHPGDLIIVAGRWLIIERVGPRTTKTKTYQGTEVMIPNSLITQSVVENLTRSDRLHRIQIRVVVDFDSDPAVVNKALREIIDGLEWCSHHARSGAYATEFSEKGVVYEIMVWINDAERSLGFKSELHETIWSGLKAKGIEIASPNMGIPVERKGV